MKTNKELLLCWHLGFLVLVFFHAWPSQATTQKVDQRNVLLLLCVYGRKVG